MGKNDKAKYAILKSRRYLLISAVLILPMLWWYVFGAGMPVTRDMLKVVMCPNAECAKGSENLYMTKDGLEKWNNANKAGEELEHQVPLVPVNKLFRNIKKLGLYINDFQLYEMAVKCHGREGECADQTFTLKVQPEKRPSYIAWLKQLYADYPAPLRRDALQDLLLNEMKSELMPFVSSGQQEIVILDADTIDEFANQEGALVVAVGFDVVDDAKPHLGIISVDFYRRDCQDSMISKMIFSKRTTVIPLDLTEEEMGAHVRQFVDAFEVTATTEFN